VQVLVESLPRILGREASQVELRFDGRPTFGGHSTWQRRSDEMAGRDRLLTGCGRGFGPLEIARPHANTLALDLDFRRPTGVKAPPEADRPEGQHPNAVTRLKTDLCLDLGGG